MSELFFGKLNPKAKQVVCIVAGGSGTRFWPLSRTSKPKQFLSLDGKTSLIQQTVERLDKFIDNNLLVVTAKSQVELVREHLPNTAILAEPVAKNTAPALFYAASRILSEVGDVPIVCLPADHIIKNNALLCELLDDAIELARAEDLLITIGLKPSSPETGFGYIKKGEAKEYQTETRNRPCAIAEFIEKPNLETARKYLASGEYFWNSGMFIWRPSVLLAAAKKFLPETHQKISQIESIFKLAGDEQEVGKIFSSIDPISIDYGVMEKASNIALFVADDLEWSDVGSWSSWAEACGSSNVEIISIDSSNCYVNAKPGKTVAIVGLDNLIVVDTGDALLVCNKDQVQKVKDVVEELKKRGETEVI